MANYYQTYAERFDLGTVKNAMSFMVMLEGLKFPPTEYSQDGPTVYFGDLEGGDIDGMVRAIQDWMVKANFDEALVISWAYGCEKLRPGDFGGGAVNIKKDSDVWFNARESAMHA